jgi:hypothetical protein
VFDDARAINDLGDSIAVARSDKVHALGFDGSGIRVAVFEGGPSNINNLSFAVRFSNNPAASDHARLTSPVIKNIEPNKPHGHAPDCDLALPDDRAGGRQLLAGRRRRHPAAGGRVRQAQGLQHDLGRQPRRQRRRDVGRLGVPQPELGAWRPSATA